MHIDESELRCFELNKKKQVCNIKLAGLKHMFDLTQRKWFSRVCMHSYKAIRRKIYDKLKFPLHTP